MPVPVAIPHADVPFCALSMIPDRDVRCAVMGERLGTSVSEGRILKNDGRRTEWRRTLGPLTPSPFPLMASILGEVAQFFRVVEHEDGSWRYRRGRALLKQFSNLDDAIEHVTGIASENPPSELIVHRSTDDQRSLPPSSDDGRTDVASLAAVVPASCIPDGVE